MLWSEALAVTLKGEPLFADAGLETVVLFTLMSEVARTAVTELLLRLLLLLVGSETCS